METNWYYNNISFRIAAPLLLGIVVYMLVLLFFDSVDQLFTNMFSREAVFVISLTVVFMEVNRLVIILSKKLFPIEKNIKLRITTQLLLSLVLSISIISLLLNWYFIHFEGFNTIITELITFNSIYIVAVILFNLYYFSIVFLHKRNDSKIIEESLKKASLELEMETFKYQVNPDFLFQSLEIIISELHRNKQEADEMVNNLASVYRFTLDNKDEDLVLLSSEIESLHPVIKLFKAKYGNSIEYNADYDAEICMYLIPGTLRVIFEEAITQNIISDSLPLFFDVVAFSDKIKVKYSLNEKLKVNGITEKRMVRLRNAYSYLSKFGLDCEKKDGQCIYTIPLLNFEEE